MAVRDAVVEGASSCGRPTAAFRVSVTVMAGCGVVGGGLDVRAAVNGR
jgi:hypothetical protein